MTTAKRLLTTLGLALTIVVGAGIPASAGFGDTAGLPTMSVATGTVTAPTQVEAKLLCTTNSNGSGGTSRELKIEWQRSLSRGVTGYEITVHPASGAPYRLAVTGPTDEAYFTADQALIDSKPSFTVTTLTSYAWSATSTRQGITPC